MSDKLNNIAFLGGLAILFLVYGLHESFDLKPQGIHQWRQADCLSYALNYYEDDVPFLEPQVQNLGGTGSSKVVSEFPVIYYTVGQLWRVFGQYEWIFRLVNYLICFLGLWSLWSIARAYLDDFWALIMSALIFSSPIFVYYSGNFLANVPAMSLAFFGIFLFSRYLSKERIIYLFAMALVFTLAAVIKITALLAFLVIMFLWLMERLRWMKVRARPLFYHPWIFSAISIVSLAVIAGWFMWASHYKAMYNSGFFLVGIRPIWLMNAEQIVNVLDLANKLWIRSVYPVWFMVLSLIVYVWTIANSRGRSIIYWLPSTLFILAFIAYALLFFKVLNHHDYYVTNFLIIFISIWFSFVALVKERRPELFHSLKFKAIGVLTVLLLILHCSSDVRSRYKGWKNEHLVKTYAFETITPYLRSLGIDRNDPTIILPDKSINITLYLSDQKGWTGFNTNAVFNSIIVDEDRFQTCLDLGAKYMLIYKEELLTDDVLSTYLEYPLGVYENVRVYDLRPYTGQSDR
jgi:hypothetical protein